MTSSPIDGGPGGVPYTRGMWRRFQEQMGTLAEAERRREEKPVEQKADDLGEIVRELTKTLSVMESAHEKQNPMSIWERDVQRVKHARDALERLSERCEAYKGQVKAGAEEIGRLSAERDGLLQRAKATDEKIDRLTDARDWAVARAEAAEKERERKWRKACGTVTRNDVCDCNVYGEREPNFVNYADSLQADAREQFERAEAAEAKVRDIREATLRMVAGLFAESVHETYTRDEVVSVVEDMIELGRAPAAAKEATHG